MAKKKQDVIPNWTIFGTHQVAIEIHEHSNEDGDVFYNSCLLVFLDDGKDRKDEDALVITISLDMFNEDYEELIFETAVGISSMFQSVSDVVIVFDQEVDIKEELSLTEFMNEYQAKLAGDEKPKMNNATFH